MCVLSKSEVFHRGEHLAERIGNLCHGRYLPVQVPAKDRMHLSPLTRIDPHINLRTHGHPLNKTSQSYKEPLRINFLTLAYGSQCVILSIVYLTRPKVPKKMVLEA